MNDFRDLCYHMGLAPTTWQSVEEAHYKIFTKMLGVPIGGVGSVVYFFIESFDARRRMVDNMAKIVLDGRRLKRQRAQWEGLKGPLKQANDDRNKLAHYGIDYDLINGRPTEDGGYVFNVTPHTLRPSQWNELARLLDRSKDKPGHNLGVDEVKTYVRTFRQLAQQLEGFHGDLQLAAETTEPQSPSE